MTPDGTTLIVPPNSIITVDGTWAFDASPVDGGYGVLLNGRLVGVAITLTVTNGGKLYALNAFGELYEWVGTEWVLLTGNSSPPSRTLSLVVTPPNPVIAPNSPGGTFVANLHGIWSDGSAFSGSYAFVAPNYDDGGIYTIILNDDHSGSLIVNPSGPGVGSGGGTIENVSVVARE